jgi:amino acid adenylation domain-containing protein
MKPQQQPQYLCIHQLFEIQARKNPAATALIFGNMRMSYGELDILANRLAHQLKALGVGPETLVALCVERSLEMVVALLGILKAGGAYLCIDPEYPIERQAFMLEDSRAVLLLAQSHLVKGLPVERPRTILLDDQRLFQGREDGSPLSATTPESLAYMTYTSGSTGIPKGTEILHRSIPGYLFNVDYAELNNEQTFLQYNSLSWDALTLELWTPLLHGARCVLFQGRVPTLSEMASAIQEHGVTIMFFTGSMFNAVIDSMPEAIAGVKQLWVGGEIVSVPHVRRAQELSPATKIVNVYGPSECTVFSTAYPIREKISEESQSIPIGKPIGDRKIYLLDASSRPVPKGTPGELCVGGPAVARGYLNCPELTAAMFTPNPFSKEPGARLYRSGDLARYLSDGNIDFIGRIDRQVKLRGHRIELAEIEWILRQHEAVSDAVTIVREDTQGDKRVVAYVVARADGERSAAYSREEYSTQQVSEWQSVFEDIYLPEAQKINPLMNFIGWNSSYTGEPIPEEEMREWLSGTVERILSLKPERALEIGCGTGLLLFQVAPHCSQYSAKDFSDQALDYVRGQLDRLRASGSAINSVALEQGTADDFKGIKDGSFDTVILNSIAQYFPSADYLRDVVKGAVSAVAPGGHIFIGDVRSLPLLDALHTSIELSHAVAGDSCRKLWDRVKRRAMEERELAVDPRFFLALSQEIPEIAGVEILLKRGRNHNELNRFRYDLIIHTGKQDQTETDYEEWQGEQSLDRLRNLLETGNGPDTLAFRGVSNARLLGELKAVEYLSRSVELKTVAELRKRLQGADEFGMNPEDFWSLGEQYGYDVEVGWDGSESKGSCRVRLRRRSGATSSCRLAIFADEVKSPASYSKYTNQPVTTKVLRQISRELRGYLKSKLPDYMIPSAFVMLNELPLTSSGKLDHKRLPEPDRNLLELERRYVEPRTPIEETLLKLWSDVLGLERIGVEDNFFELGGHSLMATQVISRIRETFGIELPLRALFDAGTVAALGKHIEHAKSNGRQKQRPSISITDRAALRSRAVNQLKNELESASE